jgi:hypothetical protein
MHSMSIVLRDLLAAGSSMLLPRCQENFLSLLAFWYVATFK